MSRSPNLDEKALEMVVAVVGRMKSPISWKSVIAAVENDTGFAYTRQALAKHARVIAAYRELKHGRASQPSERPLSFTARARKRADTKQKTEVEALRATLWRYEEMIILIFNNAYALNISEERLLRPLASSSPAAGLGKRHRSR